MSYEQTENKQRKSPKYKVTLSSEIKKSGKTRRWLSNQLNEMTPKDFWKKVNSDTLSKNEKDIISRLLASNSPQTNNSKKHESKF